MNEYPLLDEQLKRRLNTHPVPVIDGDHKRALLAQMVDAMPQAKTRWQRLREWYPLAVLLSQIKIIRAEIFLASAVVLALGVLVTLGQRGANGLTFSAIAPLVAAGSIAVLYDARIRVALELENSTPTSAQRILLARLTIVYSFNLVLALLGSVILTVLRTDLSLLPLIASWLAPMAFLSGLAFFLSIVLVDTLAATAFSMMLWIVHLLLRDARADEIGSVLHLLSVPGLSAPSTRPFLFAAAALLVIVALWLVDIQENNIGSVS